MDIEITNPMKINMDTIEVDESLPSIKFSVRVSKNSFFGLFELRFDTWFECADFDAFLRGLQSDGVSKLVDIDGRFNMCVDCSACTFELNYTAEDFKGNSTSFNHREKLTDEFKSKLNSQFNNYPRWW